MHRHDASGVPLLPHRRPLCIFVERRGAGRCGGGGSASCPVVSDYIACGEKAEHAHLEIHSSKRLDHTILVLSEPLDRDSFARLAIAGSVNIGERPAADDPPQLEAADRAVASAPVRPNPDPIIVEHWPRLRHLATTATAHECGGL